jgi:ankyrin repeat protein
MLRGHVTTLRALLRYGNARRIDFGFTLGTSRLVAVEAAGRGDADILRVLFEEAGVSTEVVNGYGRTALLEAAQNGKVDAVTVCLECGADIKFATKLQNNTAAHFAAENGHLDVLNMLRNAGADMDVERNGDFKSPLQLHRELIAKQMKAVLNK